MEARQFVITINSPKEKVWRIMLGPETFKVWTEAFSKGSYFEGSWEKGEKIRFLTPEGQGMTSVIAENKPFEFLSIKHLGFIKDGVEDTDSPGIRSWTPAFESYTFSGRGGATEVKVDMDVLPGFEEFMNEAWPKALAKLKEICEE